METVYSSPAFCITRFPVLSYVNVISFPSALTRSTDAASSEAKPPEALFVLTYSRKDVSNFRLRKGMPIGVKVTLRDVKMYEFLERLVRVSLPRIRDFNGIAENMDGKGNYTLGLKEQLIFPEVDIDKNPRIHGMEITFVTTAKTDEEAHALLAAFGLPFKKHNN